MKIPLPTGGLMEQHKVKRLPVIADGSLVGVVSRADLVRALVERAQQPVSGDTGDAGIRGHTLVAIAAEPWGRRFDVCAWVKDGVVDIGGTSTSEDERAALKVLAENTPGGKAARDRLVRVEPLSGTVLPPEGSPPTIGQCEKTGVIPTGSGAARRMIAKDGQEPGG